MTRTMRTAEILASMKSNRFDPGFDLNDVFTQPGPEPDVESLHLSDHGFTSSRPGSTTIRPAITRPPTAGRLRRSRLARPPHQARANQTLIDRNCNAQVSRWNRRCILDRALVLAVEQSFQLSLQIVGLAVLFSCFKSIHGWSIVPPECFQEF